MFIVRRLIWPCFALLFLLVACQSSEDSLSRLDPASGVTDTEIRIGSSLALSGHASYLGVQTLRGAQSYINHINDSGGIHGRTIKIVTLDDQYDPPKCLHNTQGLIVDEQVFCLFSYVGTPTTGRIVPVIEKCRVPLVGALTGARALREPFRRYVVNVRASYYQETAAAVKHLVEDLNISRIGVFYQYDSYGFDGLRGTELALQHYGLTPVASGSYIRGTLDVGDGLSNILASDAEAVVMIGTYEPSARFIQLAKASGKSILFYNVSFVGGEELVRLLGSLGENVIVSEVVPPPTMPSAQSPHGGVREYIELLKRYYPQETPNFVGLEGYFNARILVEGLRRAGRNLTRESFIDAIDTIRDYNIGLGNTVTFGPSDHQGMDQVYFTRISNGTLHLISDWKAFAAGLGQP
ncbi:MAG: ABC transporter substrate-binding protein [Desulfovibrionaceae bacterium]